jgi:hypothetical protein
VSEEGARLEEDATLTHRGHCQEMSGKPRLDDAELQKDFQLAVSIFSLSTRALTCFAIAAAAPCDTERYTEAFHRRMARRGSAGIAMRQLVMRGAVDRSTHPHQSLGMHLFLYLPQPIEVMKFLRKISQTCSEKTMSRSCLETF